METTEEVKPEAPKPEVKESLAMRLIIAIPVPVVRWFGYIVLFAAFLAPGFICDVFNVGAYITQILILSHFSSQLNKLISK